MKTYYLTIVMMLIFISCKSQDENISATSISFGKISLGDPITIAEHHYENIILEENGSEGFYWPSYRVEMKDNKWLIYEDINNDGKINLIKTNSSKFVCKDGLSVGVTIKELNLLSVEFEIFSDVGGLEFITLDTDIIFRIDDKSVQYYFDEGGEFPENLRLDAKVIEIEIRNIN